MMEEEQVQSAVAECFRADSRRVFASLVRLLRDFDLAEEALQEAYSAAVENWPREGIPDNPSAWLVSTGRFKAVDLMRRKAKLGELQGDIARRLHEIETANRQRDAYPIEDDRLRLIFTCCHPAIDPSVQVALTLREVCGLTTEEISRAFLVNSATMAQRLVRGKAKIRDAGIPISIPSHEELPERLESVLAVVYLVFNEGYSASYGESVTRAELCSEAIRLGRLLLELLPDPEVIGLLALMLLQESRREARATIDGDIILLEDQDRRLWNREQIDEGLELTQRALASRRFAVYGLQAALAAEHARADSAEDTNWNQIVALYDALRVVSPSPVVELNRAVAIAMQDTPAQGLAIIEELLASGALANYHLAHAARADLLRRLGNSAGARKSYQTALTMARAEPERRFLLRRLESLS